MTPSATSPARLSVFDTGVVVVACVGAAVALWLLPASVEIVTWPSSGPVRVALFAPLVRLWLALGAAAAASAALLLVGSPSVVSGFRACEEVAVGVVRAFRLARHGRPKGLHYLRFFHRLFSRTTAGPSKSGRHHDLCKGSRAARVRLVAPLSVLWLWAVPYLPWLPDRAPVLLILAGPIRWLVAAAALGGVLATWAELRAWYLTPLPLPGRKTVFVVTLALYVWLGLRSLDAVGLGGDEPHYLIITHSLLVDHDLKIENNHARGDYHAFFGGDLRPDYLRRGQNGEIYSIHSPGLSVLLLPAYSVAGARGALITMCLFGALAALAVYDVAWLFGGSAIALLTWASVCLTVPFVPHSWMLFPEMTGAAIVAWAVQWLATPLLDRRTVWLGRGAVLAALPWLHTKFVVFLAVLAALLLLRLRTRIKDAAVFVLPILLSSIAWLAFFYVVYGNADPQAPYGTYTDQFVRFGNIPRSLLGILVDQKFGLLVYSPVYLIAGAGAWLLLRDRAWRGFAAALLVTAVPYVISSTRLYMWWGGSSAPARFLVPVLPLLAPLIAAGLSGVRGRVARAMMTMLIGFSVLIAAVGVLAPAHLFLFSNPHGVARLLEAVQGSAPAAAALPTFTEEHWKAPLARLLPWVVAATTAVWLAALVASRARRLTAFWTGIVMAVAFVLAGSVLSGPFSAPVRADSMLRGRLGLLAAYDPDRLRGFDYGAMAKLDAAALLRASALTIERQVDEPVDEQGRIAGPLSLPPGRYDARVWFLGERPRDGDLLLSLGGPNIGARVNGPLANPATLEFDLPVQFPSFWLMLTEPSSARALQRVEITPVSVQPESRRVDVNVWTVESIPGHSNAYIVYAESDSYPEGGVFWTRGTSPGEVFVAPAGASRMDLTLRIGPAGGMVRLNVDGRNLDAAMSPNETRRLSIPIAPGATLVPVRIQSQGSFRPAEVDSRSNDTRELGCQVRVELS